MCFFLSVQHKRNKTFFLFCWTEGWLHVYLDHYHIVKVMYNIQFWIHNNSVTGFHLKSYSGQTGFLTRLIQSELQFFWLDTNKLPRDSEFVFPQKNGHKEDIICAAQCPPSLLATSSYDGEIIVWNVISGCIQCRFVSPLAAEQQQFEGNLKQKKEW